MSLTFLCSVSICDSSELLGIREQKISHVDPRGHTMSDVSPRTFPEDGSEMLAENSGTILLFSFKTQCVERQFFLISSILTRPMVVSLTEELPFASLVTR